MDDNTKNEVREYIRGLEDGRSGREYDDGSNALTALVTFGLAGGPRKDSDDYREGFRDGREDRKR